jgi:hypothetical protein
MKDPKEELFKQLRSIDMANAKEELLGHLERNKSIVKCATINCSLSNWYREELTEDRRSIDLKEGYTQEEYEEFLHRLDFEYDNGYGGQQVYGTVWLMEENTWIERGEYDGSEWWEYKQCPKIPNELKA